jgi:hypothetical protein
MSSNNPTKCFSCTTIKLPISINRQYKWEGEDKPKIFTKSNTNNWQIFNFQFLLQKVEKTAFIYSSSIFLFESSGFLLWKIVNYSKYRNLRAPLGRHSAQKSDVMKKKM